MAFGFGLTVLLLLSGVRTGLLDTWYASLPTDAPNHFMINIQREEADGIRALFTEYGQEAPELVPMVRGRLTAIDGEDVMSRRMRGEGGWLFREANLTWAEELDATNEVVAGEWWAPGTERAEISVEEGIMQGLGLELGDELTFEIGGMPLTATLTSVRRVEWDSLSPNFMLVLNPAALADYPATFVASTYAPNREVMLEVVAAIPECHRHRSRVRARAGAKHHGPRRTRDSVRVPVHAARRRRRAARGRAGDARGAPLRSRAAAHARRDAAAACWRRSSSSS